MQNNENELEKISKPLVNYVAKQLAKDVTESEIVNDLTNKGFNKQQAQELVRHVATHELNAMSKAGKRAAPMLIVIGLVLVTLGVVMTVVTLKEGVGFIWYGAIIAGIGFLARGIWKLRW
jgi:hypothetical protein